MGGMYDKRNRGYDVALVCENGHVINASSATYVQRNSNFCDQCGAKTINVCQSCNEKIRGYEIGYATYGYELPKYCHNCGMAYPWQENAIIAALEYTDEIEDLNDEQRQQLKSLIPDLAKNSPQTQVATLRYSNLVTKMSKAAGSALRELLVDVVSEAAKKALWP